jgi:hypothetical protein
VVSDHFHRFPRVQVSGKLACSLIRKIVSYKNLYFTHMFLHSSILWSVALVLQFVIILLFVCQRLWGKLRVNAEFILNNFWRGVSHSTP